MAVIQGVLAEELENSERMLRKYQAELKALPRGSLVEKKIRGGKFYYLALRHGAKVKFIYKGKLELKEIERYREAKKMKAKHRRLIADLKKQIIFIKRALHERKRRPA